MTNSEIAIPVPPDDDVVSHRVTLTNMRGLHARASAKFINCAEKFDAEIEVSAHNDCSFDTVVADSIMELLMLGAACGEEITITCRGPEAQLALQDLLALIARNFDEEA